MPAMMVRREEEFLGKGKVLGKKRTEVGMFFLIVLSQKGVACMGFCF